MKVILVAPHFRPRTGGVENYVLHIATQLVILGWQVVVVTTGSREAEELTTSAAMKVYRLPVGLTFSNTPVGVGWRRRLRQIYQAERPDVINGHTPVPYLADLAERASGSIPFVLTYHNDLHKEGLIQKAAVRFLHQTIIDRTLRRSAAIIATSDFYVRGSPYLGKYESKIKIVPPGVDLARFHPAVVVSDDLATNYAGRRVVLFVGSMNKSQRHKGLDLLISAFARIHDDSPDASLVVVGRGDAMEAYRAMAAAAGVAADVRFVGYVDDDELPQYYKLATVFAMPSTDRSEGFGMVYAEAGAVGIPVVGARVGGVPSSITHGETGLLVTPRSADELYHALRDLLADQALSRRLGEAGAARAKAELDWRPLAERTSEIFKDLCERR
jgi:glycosyltransferase involved in cell wall biosynthesis